MIVIAKQLIHEMTVDESCHPTLTIEKHYLVIGIEGDYYRIVDDVGDPVLFNKNLFEIVDPEIPDNWVVEYDEGGDVFMCPPELSEEYIYEDYFDGVAHAVEKFENYRIRHGLPPKLVQRKWIH